jgi:serine/threonine protein kinase
MPRRSFSSRNDPEFNIANSSPQPASSNVQLFTAYERLSHLSGEHSHTSVNQEQQFYSTLTGNNISPKDLGTMPADHPTHLTNVVRVIRGLGSGAYSKVEEILHIPTNVRLARKTVQTTKQSVHDYLALEVRVLQRLRHRHIIRLVGTDLKGGSLSIFLSPVAETNLAGFMETVSAGAMGSKIHLAGFFGCLVSALRHAHQNFLTHGDIKPANILITKDKVPNVVLCDFGASRSHLDGSGGRRGTRPFTWRYCAPEAVHSAGQRRPADIFSLGCVFLEMAATLWLPQGGELLHFRKTFMKAKIYHQNLREAHQWLEAMKQRASTVDKPILQSISAMLCVAAVDRPTADDLSLTFRPRVCCEAWPSAEIVSITSFEALYSLSAVKYNLESFGTRELSSCYTVDSLPQDPISTTTPIGLRIAQGFAELSIQKHKVKDDIADKFSLIKHWYRTCTTTHVDCRPMFLPVWSPFRLIDVGHTDDNSPNLRLIEWSQISTPIPYVALSYVWGDSNDGCIQLTEECYHDFQSSIPLENLPKAIATGIEVARQIGERYIWVDTLCIIQDSNYDVQRQLKDLPAIYLNACITIAITSSQVTDLIDLRKLCPLGRRISVPDISCKHGDAEKCELCKNSRQLQGKTNLRNRVPPYMTHSQSLSRSLEERYFLAIVEAIERGHSDHACLLLGDLLNDLKSNQTDTGIVFRQYSRRGWSFQERLLSQRVLYFSENQVHWECKQHKASDIFPNGLPALLWESVHNPSGSFRPPRRPYASSVAPYTPRQIRHYDIWSTLVTAYSRRDAISDLERLTSLEGSISEMAKIVNDVCLAGHWKQTCSWTLLWHLEISTLHESNHRNDHFPSWSWAGWKCPVELPKYFPGRSLIEITDFRDPKPLASGDPTSSVATLNLYGRRSTGWLAVSPTTNELHMPIYLKNGRVLNANVRQDLGMEPREHIRYDVLWTRLSTSSHLADSKLSINGILLSYDEKTDTFTRRGICTLAASSDASHGLDWSEEDITYVSDEAQIISIR